MPPVAYVYILQSAADGRFYIGYTTDLERCVRQHREGAGRWTKGKGPWKLRYFESAEARVEKKKTQVSMLQLLNPSFSSKIKVYDDPFSRKTTSLAVGSIKMAGGKTRTTSFYRREIKWPCR